MPQGIEVLEILGRYDPEEATREEIKVFLPLRYNLAHWLRKLWQEGFIEGRVSAVREKMDSHGMERRLITYKLTLAGRERLRAPSSNP